MPAIFSGGPNRGKTSVKLCAKQKQKVNTGGALMQNQMKVLKETISENLCPSS